MKMKLSLFILSGLITAPVNHCVATQEERLLELENVALYEESDVIDENEVIPTPADVKKKFNLTDAELLEDIKALEARYSIAETNAEKRYCRQMAVLWIGYYGMTNNFSFLKSIMNNPNDYAQEYALRSMLDRFRETDQLIPIAKEVVTNKTLFAYGLRGLTYTTLAGMCNPKYTNSFVNSSVVRSNITLFFIERASQEIDFTLYVDRVACDLNPSYRHSQQRRDNLARLRPAGLTGEQAEIYSARQRDALPKEDE